MKLSKKNIIEGVIGSLIATAVLCILGLLISSINIVIVDKPTTGTPIEWNFEIQPINITLPYVSTDIGQELSTLRVSLNNFFFHIWQNGFWMVILTAFTWFTVFFTMPFLRWDLLKKTYVNTNLYKQQTKRIEYNRIDKDKTDNSFIFDWLIGAYVLVAIVTFVLFRDWFLVFSLSIFVECFLWLLNFFLQKKMIHNERNTFLNVLYTLLSLPISICLAIVIIIILAFIF